MRSGLIVGCQLALGQHGLMTTRATSSSVFKSYTSHPSSGITALDNARNDAEEKGYETKKLVVNTTCSSKGKHADELFPLAPVGLAATTHQGAAASRSNKLTVLAASSIGTCEAPTAPASLHLRGPVTPAGGEDDPNSWKKVISLRHDDYAESMALCSTADDLIGNALLWRIEREREVAEHQRRDEAAAASAALESAAPSIRIKPQRPKKVDKVAQQMLELQQFQQQKEAFAKQLQQQQEQQQAITAGDVSVQGASPASSSASNVAVNGDDGTITDINIDSSSGGGFASASSLETISEPIVDMDDLAYLRYVHGANPDSDKLQKVGPTGLNALQALATIHRLTLVSFPDLKSTKRIFVRSPTVQKSASSSKVPETRTTIAAGSANHIIADGNSRVEPTANQTSPGSGSVEQIGVGAEQVAGSALPSPPPTYLPTSEIFSSASGCDAAAVGSSLHITGEDFPPTPTMLKYAPAAEGARGLDPEIQEMSKSIISEDVVRSDAGPLARNPGPSHPPEIEINEACRMEVVQSLFKEALEPCYRHMAHPQLSLLLKGLSKLPWGVTDPRSTSKPILAAMTTQALKPHAKPQDKVKVLLTLENLPKSFRTSDGSARQQLLKSALTTMGSLTGPEVSKLLLAAQRLRIPFDKEDLDLLSKYVPLSCHQCDANDLAHIFTVIAKLRHRDQHVLKSLCDSAYKTRSEFTDSNVSDMLYALGKLDFYHPKLVPELVRQARDYVLSPECRTLSVALSLWGAVKLHVFDVELITNGVQRATAAAGGEVHVNKKQANGNHRGRGGGGGEKANSLRLRSPSSDPSSYSVKNLTMVAGSIELFKELSMGHVDAATRKRLDDTVFAPFFSRFIEIVTPEMKESMLRMGVFRERMLREDEVRRFEEQEESERQRRLQEEAEGRVPDGDNIAAIFSLPTSSSSSTTRPAPADAADLAGSRLAPTPKVKRPRFEDVDPNALASYEITWAAWAIANAKEVLLSCDEPLRLEFLDVLTKTFVLQCDSLPAENFVTMAHALALLQPRDAGDSEVFEKFVRRLATRGTYLYGSEAAVATQALARFGTPTLEAMMEEEDGLRGAESGAPDAQRKGKRPKVVIRMLSPEQIELVNRKRDDDEFLAPTAASPVGELPFSAAAATGDGNKAVLVAVEGDSSSASSSSLRPDLFSSGLDKGVDPLAPSPSSTSPSSSSTSGSLLDLDPILDRRRQQRAQEDRLLDKLRLTKRVEELGALRQQALAALSRVAVQETNRITPPQATSFLKGLADCRYYNRHAVLELCAAAAAGMDDLSADQIANWARALVRLNAPVPEAGDAIVAGVTKKLAATRAATEAMAAGLAVREDQSGGAGGPGQPSQEAAAAAPLVKKSSIRKKKATTSSTPTTSLQLAAAERISGRVVEAVAVSLGRLNMRAQLTELLAAEQGFAAQLLRRSVGSLTPPPDLASLVRVIGAACRADRQSREKDAATASLVDSFVIEAADGKKGRKNAAASSSHFSSKTQRQQQQEEQLKQQQQQQQQKRHELQPAEATDPHQPFPQRSLRSPNVIQKQSVVDPDLIVSLWTAAEPNLKDFGAKDLVDLFWGLRESGALTPHMYDKITTLLKRELCNVPAWHVFKIAETSLLTGHRDGPFIDKLAYYATKRLPGMTAEDAAELLELFERERVDGYPQLFLGAAHQAVKWRRNRTNKLFAQRVVDAGLRMGYDLQGIVDVPEARLNEILRRGRGNNSSKASSSSSRPKSSSSSSPRGEPKMKSLRELREDMAREQGVFLPDEVATREKGARKKGRGAPEIRRGAGDGRTVDDNGDELEDNSAGRPEWEGLGEKKKRRLQELEQALGAGRKGREASEYRQELALDLGSEVWISGGPNRQRN